jgi:formamidopyrimidine-DNA glycosylase
VPELPEVETLCRQLRQVVLGRQILEMEVIDSKIGRFPEAIGCRITAVHRFGKSLEMVLDSGWVLRLHLRMSGRLLWRSDYHLPLPHTRFVLGFEEGWLLCIDPRRFATLSFAPVSRTPRSPVYPLLKGDLPRICALAAKRRIAVKAFLMDQTVMAGIGNIYACEILHEAAIEPDCPACDLSLPQWRQLSDAAASILKKAVRARGTTISDWHDLFGHKGENQRLLKVYGRGGQACPRCGASILRKSLGGRGTFYCPSCQR